MTVGAVASEPSAVSLWSLVRDHFADAPVTCDHVLFPTYEHLVRALLDRQIDIAWTSNLAYARVHAATDGTCRALAMRDVDARAFTSIVARPGTFSSLDDLRGRVIAFGSRDAMHASIIPAHHLRLAGLESGDDYTALRFDADLGTHGDTGASERAAVRAVIEHRADAAAIGSTFARAYRAGGLTPFWTSPVYPMHTFTALASIDPAVARAWTDHLLSMTGSCARAQRVFRASGMQRWIEPVRAGFGEIFAALEDEQFRARARRQTPKSPFIARAARAASAGTNVSSSAN